MKTAEFLLSTLYDYPSSNLPEVAFVGRSNVGKSSLLNDLLQNKKLARVSSKPGKTQLLNFFRIDDKLMIVDLPGYGYASCSKKIQAAWADGIDNYFQTREQLSLIVLLLDVRRDTLTADDRMLIEWAQHNQKKILIVFTKRDKIKRNERKSNIAKIMEQIGSSIPHIAYTIKEKMPRLELTRTLWENCKRIPLSV